MSLFKQIPGIIHVWYIIIFYPRLIVSPFVISNLF